jgi:hypothetical protein
MHRVPKVPRLTGGGLVDKRKHRPVPAKGELRYIEPVGPDDVPAILQENEIVIPVKHAKRVKAMLKEADIDLPNMAKGGRVSKRKKARNPLAVAKASATGNKVTVNIVAPYRRRRRAVPRPKQAPSKVFSNPNVWGTNAPDVSMIPPKPPAPAAQSTIVSTKPKTLVSTGTDPMVPASVSMGTDPLLPESVSMGTDPLDPQIVKGDIPEVLIKASPRNPIGEPEPSMTPAGTPAINPRLPKLIASKSESRVVPLVGMGQMSRAETVPPSVIQSPTLLKRSTSLDTGNFEHLKEQVHRERSKDSKQWGRDLESWFIQHKGTYGLEGFTATQIRSLTSSRKKRVEFLKEEGLPVGVQYPDAYEYEEAMSGRRKGKTSKK